ncbi:HD-GYP domain-containing protein (c-di-GMP phosphodiesterase class II) [Paenibacillus endophyticus]|uniref:HD-GYP domain-containing protein (C-di-GMP phosphodiesterase class II) n=1 Tax=Paenibacillus endophyticus TaxID=1294268 RepID=A0A7W5GAE0_9BACL|nr:HD-GYP domain-containing protein [Paenibacillus endophyticus]MBB3151857.1 HD-GYP domain-containing protein (c-di-GMP phosphodiesterase class II) [Paenibacillus endophyticus]
MKNYVANHAESIINNRYLGKSLFSAFFLAVFFTDIYIDNFTLFQFGYLLLCLLIGLAFWKETWARSVWVGIIVVAKVFLEQSEVFKVHDNVLLRILTLSITYFLTSTSISFMILFYMKQKQNTLQLTFTLAKALDSRDHYTADHSDNVAYYSKRIAEEMNLSKLACERIFIGGILHDIGKIGVPEHILMKPSRLTEEEFTIIKAHPLTGYDMLSHISNFKRSGILDMILHHHERFDGFGYPSGIAENRIPLAARIMAVADTFDAMTSKRVYRGELDIGYAIAEIQKNAGTQFDPQVVHAFINIWNREGTKLLPKYALPS